MKKFLVCSVIACSAICFADDEIGSGIFLGFDTGYGVSFVKTTQTQG
ncbi:hypothetical protein DCO58_10135 [Helicobacter saguini]|uniref:Outer membrane protein n=1 Tax=Helicobacter saguini TaxID=1548018 RepID=A0A6B0HSF5_9HELI|nr:hypothetical protein [Helicobacter saguini]MWV61337.1 hypothetical protein [Helicobacter saguini]MWV67993.1 hypothetical protein [Helicobacter saguini]MWV70539.1 hypothetical protein [Helicobacter saguini]MWV72443.1 hypothetical protein [Helicobacter saguini]